MVMGQRYTFFFAAREGRESDLRWILKQKYTSPNLRDGDNQLTALHMTCIRGHAKCTELLLEAGAHVNCRTTDGMTPLHYATYGGHLECLKILLHAKADVHASTRFGCTALHQAAFFNRQRCAELLIKHGGGINARESWGLTPLAVAAQKGDSQMLKMLLANKADTSNRDNLDGKTPLQISIDNNHPECAVALLDAGANPNHCDLKGRTALHYALHNKNVEILVPVLLEYGADPCILDKDYITPIDILNSKSKDNHLSPQSKEKLLEIVMRYRRGNPRSLMSQCRKGIRIMLGPSRIECIDDLPLHSIFKHYLRFES